MTNWQVYPTISERDRERERGREREGERERERESYLNEIVQGKSDENNDDAEWRLEGD